MSRKNSTGKGILAIGFLEIYFSDVGGPLPASNWPDAVGLSQSEYALTVITHCSDDLFCSCWMEFSCSGKFHRYRRQFLIFQRVKHVQLSRIENKDVHSVFRLHSQQKLTWIRWVIKKKKVPTENENAKFTPSCIMSYLECQWIDGFSLWLRRRPWPLKEQYDSAVCSTIS